MGRASAREEGAEGEEVMSISTVTVRQACDIVKKILGGRDPFNSIRTLVNTGRVRAENHGYTGRGGTYYLSLESVVQCYCYAILTMEMSISGQRRDIMLRDLPVDEIVKYNTSCVVGISRPIYPTFKDDFWITTSHAERREDLQLNPEWSNLVLYIPMGKMRDRFHELAKLREKK